MGGLRSASRAGSAQSSEAVQNLRAQLSEMSTHLEGLEKERDFYFNKVSDWPGVMKSLGSLVMTVDTCSYAISRSSSNSNSKMGTRQMTMMS